MIFDSNQIIIDYIVRITYDWTRLILSLYLSGAVPPLYLIELIKRESDKEPSTINKIILNL